jgi:hypothetical protein
VRIIQEEINYLNANKADKEEVEELDSEDKRQPARAKRSPMTSQARGAPHVHVTPVRHPSLTPVTTNKTKTKKRAIATLSAPTPVIFPYNVSSTHSQLQEIQRVGEAEECHVPFLRIPREICA